MIKVITPNPTTFHFSCDTKEEMNFVDSHKDELFDKFVNVRTNGKIKNLNDLWKQATDDEFGTTSIKAFWYKSRGLEYPDCVSSFEYFVNDYFKHFNSKLIEGFDYGS